MRVSPRDGAHLDFTAKSAALVAVLASYLKGTVTGVMSGV